MGAAPDPTNAASGEQPFSSLYPSGSTASNYIFANDSLDSTVGVNGGLQPSGYASTYFTITELSLSGSEYAPSSTGAPTLADPGDAAGEPVDPGGVDQSLSSDVLLRCDDYHLLGANGMPVAGARDEQTYRVAGYLPTACRMSRVEERVR